MSNHPLLNTYRRLPFAFERGQGCWLYDAQGRGFLDTFSGVAVSGLGYSHPAVGAAIEKQAHQLIHCANSFHSPVQTQFAKHLCSVAGMDGVFLTNSGAEANEAALKLARLFGQRKSIATPTVIVMEQASHGRTLATLTATGSRKVQAGFEPLLSGFVRVPFNNLAAIEKVAQTNPNIVAILVEPIQSDAGILLPHADYLAGLRAICDRQEWLLMLDEVQTGNGRTGRYFDYQHSGILPDIVTTAKGLGNGVPIGACLARGLAATLFQPGSHASSTGGNLLSCAAAQAVIDTIEQEQLCQRAAQLGQQMLAQLHDHFDGADYLNEIRGKGLMLAIEMRDPCPELVPLAQLQGVLLNITADKVIRLLPALTLSDAEAEQMIDAVIRIIKLYAADDRERPRSARARH